MVALWDLGIDGATEMERAIVYAVVKRDRQHIVRLLREGTYRLTPSDRAYLANYLEGAFKNPVGRRPKRRMLPLERAIAESPAQRAADQVRAELEEARAAGRSVYGLRPHFAKQYAEAEGVSVETVMNHLNRARPK